MADVLTEDEIAERAPEHWTQEGEEVVRVYEFDDYLNGVEFANDVAEVADEEVHHPEIRIRYGEVEIRLTSHEEGGVTETDIGMAERFDGLA